MIEELSMASCNFCTSTIDNLGIGFSPRGKKFVMCQVCNNAYRAGQASNNKLYGIVIYGNDEDACGHMRGSNQLAIYQTEKKAQKEWKKLDEKFFGVAGFMFEYNLRTGKGKMIAGANMIGGWSFFKSINLETKLVFK